VVFRFDIIRVVAIATLILTAIGSGWPRVASAADADVVESPQTPDGAAATKGSGWQVETGPVWRLDLRSGGLGSESGTAGFGAETSGIPAAIEGADAASSIGRYRALEGSPETGAVIGYHYGIGDDDRESLGINLQLLPETSDAFDRLLLQPGLQYQRPIVGGLLLNARVFSTYASDAVGSDNRDLLHNSGDTGSGTGFRDVGLGLGIGYSLTNQWVIHTQAGVARQLESEPGSTNAEAAKGVNQFFGGVVVKYRF
jgi:hypothetical protein